MSHEALIIDHGFTGGSGKLAESLEEVRVVRFSTNRLRICSYYGNILAKEDISITPTTWRAPGRRLIERLRMKSRQKRSATNKGTDRPTRLHLAADVTLNPSHRAEPLNAAGPSAIEQRMRHGLGARSVSIGIALPSQICFEGFPDRS
jgi:hypothetical protein